MTGPLATDIDTLLSLIASGRSTVGLSAHARRRITRLVGSDPNPLRAAAIVSREIDKPHLFVNGDLIDACIRDRLDGLCGLTAHEIVINPDDDGVDTFRSVDWIDGPSIAAARAALAPLWACGVVDGGDWPSRSCGIDPDGNVLRRPKRATRETFYSIVLGDQAKRIDLSRTLSPSTRARCEAALARARIAHGLPDEIEIVPTASGFVFRHVEADRIQAVIDEVTAATIAAPEAASDQ